MFVSKYKTKLKLHSSKIIISNLKFYWEHLFFLMITIIITPYTLYNIKTKVKKIKQCNAGYITKYINNDNLIYFFCFIIIATEPQKN